jgi:hypothetical protein
MRIQIKDLTTITHIVPEDKACITIRSKKEDMTQVLTEKISWQELEFVQRVLSSAQGKQTEEGVYIHEDLFIYLACEVELNETGNLPLSSV